MVFRSYPQLIRKLFNAYRFGPPSSVTWTSAWPRVDHLVSRLPTPTKAPCSGSLSLRLRASSRLTSPVRATRRLIMQKARHHGTTRTALTACRRTVSGTISLPCCGCFSPFPHGTCALSVSGECLALADGPAGFTRGFTCPALLRVPLRFARLRVRGCHPLRRDFPDASARLALALVAALQPRRDRNPGGLGYSPVARRYWGNHFCFLFLRVLRCFSSPGSPPPTGGMAALRAAGLPHSGTRGSTAACASPRLFAACRAFHRLPEPQASAVRPFLLSPVPRCSARDAYLGTACASVQTDTARQGSTLCSLLVPACQ